MHLEAVKHKNMKNKADYSKYECPYSHLEKECGHELHGPEGYQDVYGVWCACGFRAPVFYLDPDELGLKLKKKKEVKFWNDTIQEIAKLRKPVVIKSFCPKCGSDRWIKEGEYCECAECMTLFKQIVHAHTI